MPFTKTEVDIHTDYVVETVDPAWLSQGVRSPKHLMLDPDNCILCRACEDVCPWKGCRRTRGAAGARWPPFPCRRRRSPDRQGKERGRPG